MSKVPYFIIPALTTAAGTIIGMLVVIPPAIIGGCIGLGIGLIINIICARICNVSRYIPSVDVYYSINGKDFSSNIYAIPLHKNFYLKFAISIKSCGILWKLCNPVISCDISYHNAWTLHHFDNGCNYKCVLQRCPKESKEESGNTTTSKFKIAASDRPRKTEVIFKVTQEKETNRNGESMFSINYSKQVNNVYSLVIKPGFVDSHGEIC
jgi:hypothetical protein